MLPIAAHAQISGDVVKIGVLTDMAGVTADITGKGSLLAAEMAVERDRRHGARQARAGRSRPIISTRPKSALRSRDNGSTSKASMRSLTCRTPALRSQCRGSRATRSGSSSIRARARRPHQRAVLALRLPLDLRHLRRVARDRVGGGQGRRHVVVHSGLGLRFRAPVAGRRDQGDHGRGRQGGGRGAPSAQHRGFLVLSAARAILRRKGRRHRQCRQRHRQHDEAGPRVRAGAGRSEPRRADPVPAGRARARAGRGAGHVSDDGLLLGHERCDARMVEGIHGARPE